MLCWKEEEERGDTHARVSIQADDNTVRSWVVGVMGPLHRCIQELNIE